MMINPANSMGTFTQIYIKKAQQQDSDPAAEPTSASNNFTLDDVVLNENLYTEKQEIPDVAFAIAKYIKNHPYTIAEPYLKETMLKL